MDIEKITTLFVSVDVWMIASPLPLRPFGLAPTPLQPEAVFPVEFVAAAAAAAEAKAWGAA